MSNDQTTPKANDNGSDALAADSTPTDSHSLSQSEDRRAGCFTFTFPHSSTRTTWGEPAHQPISRSQTPSTSLPSDANDQDTSRRTGPPRLMTDEGLESALDHINDSQWNLPRSNPGADDIEAWVEASKQTIVKKPNNQQEDQAVVEKQRSE